MFQLEEYISLVDNSVTIIVNLNHFAEMWDNGIMYTK